MPRQDKTGPMGRGPLTGRGMGPCGAEMGFGRRANGRGLGLRRFWGYYPAPSVDKKQEAEILAQDAELMEEELKNIKVRLAEIKGQK